MVAFASGVSAGDIARWLLAEAYFVVIPGVLIARVLLPRSSVVERLALGWALAHIVSATVFVALTWIGAQWLHVAYPLAAGALAWWFGRSSRLRESTTPAAPAIAIYAAGALAVVTVVVFALDGFVLAPIDLGARGVNYYPDLVFGQSLAADAASRASFTAPWVAGLEYKYHWLGFVQMGWLAAASGVELHVVVFRLFYLSQLPLLTVLLVAAGRALFRSWLAAILGATVVLLVGTWDFIPTRLGFSSLTSSYFLSPSTLAGAVMFTAALVAVVRLAGPEAGAKWTLLSVVFVLATAAAKVTAAPVLVGGAVGAALWTRGRREDGGYGRAAIVVTAAAAAAFGLFYLGAEGGLGVGPPFRYLTAFPSWAVFADEGGAVAVGLAAVVTVLVAHLPMAGMLIRPDVTTHRPLLVMAALAGIGATYVFDQPGLSQGYFLSYALIAGGLASGGGAAALASGLATVLGSRRLLLTWSIWLAGATAVVVLAHRVLAAGSATPPSIQTRLLVTLGAALVACTLFAVIIGDRMRSHGRVIPVGTMMLVGALSLGLLDAPLDANADLRAASSNIADLDATEPGPRGVGAGLVEGLRWIRDHTADDAVLVVNNHYIDRADSDARYFYYSAFSERRVVLESWFYTPQAFQAGADAVRAGLVPFERRFDLTAGVYADRDPREALDGLVADYGASHVLVDKANGPEPVADLTRYAELVYSSATLDVYELERSPVAMQLRASGPHPADRR